MILYVAADENREDIRSISKRIRESIGKKRPPNRLPLPVTAYHCLKQGNL